MIRLTLSPSRFNTSISCMARSCKGINHSCSNKSNTCETDAFNVDLELVFNNGCVSNQARTFNSVGRR